MTNQIATTNQEPVNVLAIIQNMASRPEFDVNKMLDLLNMQERVMAKQAEIAFNLALSRLDFPRIEQTSKISHNGKVISTYAKYEDIDAVIRPIYSREGFFLSFDSQNHDGKITIIGTLSHKDGHSRKAELQLPLDSSGSKSAIQSMGSTLSYGKRYLAGMLLNFVTKNEDDDGNQGRLNPIDGRSVGILRELLAETKADEKKFLQVMGIAALEELKQGDYAKAINMLMTKKSQQKVQP